MSSKAPVVSTAFKVAYGIALVDGLLAVILYPDSSTIVSIFLSLATVPIAYFAVQLYFDRQKAEHDKRIRNQAKVIREYTRAQMQQLLLEIKLTLRWWDKKFHIDFQEEEEDKLSEDTVRESRGRFLSGLEETLQRDTYEFSAFGREQALQPEFTKKLRDWKSRLDTSLLSYGPYLTSNLFSAIELLDRRVNYMLHLLEQYESSQNDPLFSRMFTRGYTQERLEQEASQLLDPLKQLQAILSGTSR